MWTQRRGPSQRCRLVGAIDEEFLWFSTMASDRRNDMQRSVRSQREGSRGVKTSTLRFAFRLTGNLRVVAKLHLVGCAERSDAQRRAGRISAAA
ncbi:MAG TPA: hypothetical protein VM847_18880 [Tahibacter sp.]|nr:hypothetical protein [Tahibacter sp.]